MADCRVSRRAAHVRDARMRRRARRHRRVCLRMCLLRRICGGRSGSRLHCRRPSGGGSISPPARHGQRDHHQPHTRKTHARGVASFTDHLLRRSPEERRFERNVMLFMSYVQWFFPPISNARRSCERACAKKSRRRMPCTPRANSCAEENRVPRPERSAAPRPRLVFAKLRRAAPSH